MAAYAALMSLMHTIHQMQHHPLLPLSLQKTQSQSLSQNIFFLEEFLEGYNLSDVLESRVADAAHAAEDMIESHIRNQILDAADLYEDLQKVIEDMDSIKKEVMELKQKKGGSISMVVGSSSRSSNYSTQENNALVGVDDVLYELMDKLTGGEARRQVIPIVGMGGIGKTTLARNIYQSQTIVQHFDILVWVTISQEYSVSEILLELLQVKQGSLSKVDDNKLGDNLHKKLYSRRYLIVMDDIWDIKIWDKLRFYFPDNMNGSRILLTTRLSNLAFQVSDSHGIEVGFLDEHNSWNLFCKTVFGEENCPNELEIIGRKIVRSCKGLPLSIDVIGGLLARSPRSQQYWENIAENLSSVVNSDNDDHCLKVLYTSYNSLPVYLKPCFLYMSISREDSDIVVCDFIRMWIAEGFIKPIGGKSLEDVGEECLEELVGRNLILVKERDFHGKLKLCRIHDLLRDLCLREAERQKFGCRLSKVYSKEYSVRRNLLEDILQRVGLRYISAKSFGHELPSSIYLLCYLQTVIVEFVKKDVVPFEIWNMPQLRHVEIRPTLELMNPPPGDKAFVLEDLQTLSTAHNFKCCREVVKRIPNIKKLRVAYWEVGEASSNDYCLENIELLCKLSSLSVNNYARGFSSEFPEMTFPHSLKKLTLRGTRLEWQDVTEKIGSLPLLQVLRLREYACTGREWHTEEGQFCSLKFLEISGAEDLEYWETDSSHFPRLEQLRLGYLRKLKEIPLSVGDITTLQSIQLDRFCSDSAFDSAKQVRDEQEDLGNESLQVQLFF